MFSLQGTLLREEALLLSSSCAKRIAQGTKRACTEEKTEVRGRRAVTMEVRKKIKSRPGIQAVNW